MPVKVNIGLSKKVGLPDYGSLGASAHVEFELDGGYDNGSTESFQGAVRRAYLACRQAVEREIADNKQSQASVTPQNESPRASTARPATVGQVRAIHAIAGHNRVSLDDLLLSKYRVQRPEELGVKEASSLIDYLKSSNAVPQ